MDKFDAGDFWAAYREALERLGSWKAYRNNRLWTAVAKEAATSVCKTRFALRVSYEEMRLDVMGWGKRAKSDWFLRIAYEHENHCRTWREELCKLAHVVADLCVLSSYYARGEHVDKDLQDAVGSLKERLLRVPGRQWLFVFGPRSNSPNLPFRAFSLDDKGQVVPLPDDTPLRPESLSSGGD